MTNYNDGFWHGWNGGECPVHPETLVEVVWDEREIGAAKDFFWSHDGNADIIAFRVITPYVEPKKPREFWLREGLAFEECEKHKLEHWSGEIIRVREVLPE